MSEANAEDGLLWSWTIKNVKMSEAQYRNRICILFFVRPEFRQNETDGASGGFLPRPLLLRLRNPNQSRVCQILSPRKKFWQNRGRHVPSPARILGGQNTKEKCPFHFQEKFHPRQIKKARDIFLWCCRVKRGSGGTMRAYDLVSSHHARGACALVSLMFEKGSSKVYDYSTIHNLVRKFPRALARRHGEGGGEKSIFLVR